jgi:hypothetical protein
VEVVGPADVVAWDYSDKRCRPVRLGRLDSAKVIVIDLIRATVAVSFGNNTSIDSLDCILVSHSQKVGLKEYRGVAAPELDVGIRDRLASCHINDINVQVGDYTLLARCDIASNQFATDPW